MQIYIYPFLLSFTIENVVSLITSVKKNKNTFWASSNGKHITLIFMMRAYILYKLMQNGELKKKVNCEHLIVLYFTGSICKSMQNIMVLSKYGFFKALSICSSSVKSSRKYRLGSYGTKIEKGRNFIVLSSRSIVWTKSAQFCWRTLGDNIDYSSVMSHSVGRGVDAHISLPYSCSEGLELPACPLNGLEQQVNRYS